MTEAAGVEVPIVWAGRRARAFVPSRLADRDFAIGSRTVERAARAEADVLHSAAAMPEDYLPLARLLLRAEGVASSFIEGVAAPVAEVVLAEVRASGTSDAASWIAANSAAVREATATDQPLSVGLLLAWHRTLMAGTPTPARHVGRLRREQGWIGGSSPLDAHLVTPPPEMVPGLIDDLVAYANREDVQPVVQAAIAHAQFEVIHPFADGNGRIGRVLIAALLVRRLGLLTPPPVSVRLAADRAGYAAGLVQFRLGFLDEWVSWFSQAVSGAGREQIALVSEVALLRADWERRLAGGGRSSRGVRRDSGAWRTLDVLAGRLVLTPRTIADRLGISVQAAHASLRALERVGIVTRYRAGAAGSGVGRPANVYVSEELLGLAGATPIA